MHIISIGNPFHEAFVFSDLVQNRVNVVNSFLPDIVSKDSIIIFGGGADINPKIYGEKPEFCMGFSANRDILEVAYAEEGIKKGAKLLGICRGAQLLCAMNGGKLIQDVNNHTGADHAILTNDGREMLFSTAHHQMMYPWTSKEEFEIIATTKGNLATKYNFGTYKKYSIPKADPEIIWWPKTKSLCIQGHPEFMGEKEEGREYSRELFSKYFLTN